MSYSKINFCQYNWIMAEIYSGYNPAKVLAQAREAVTSGERNAPKSSSYWAQYGTTESGLDSNVWPEICRKDAKDIEEREMDEQGCTGHLIFYLLLQGFIAS
jgi:hypothetical protein